MEYILIVWLYASTAQPLRVDKYINLAACVQAGKIWEATQNYGGGMKDHFACLPYQ
jgi:hypothetical protein